MEKGRAVTNRRESVVVRDAGMEDAGWIVEFNARMAEETEGKGLDRGVLEAGVRAGLTRPELARYFVAEVDTEVVGTTLITYELTDWRNGVLWWLQSVYVRPEYRGRGVFGAIYRHIERLAREDPEARGIRLYVRDDNEAAMRRYEALGMRPAGYRVYERDWSGSD